MVAESDLIRLRTREGMKVAKAKGRLRGKQPKLNRKQEAHLVSLVHSGEYSTLEVAELFGVGRSTVYRAIERQRSKREPASRRRHRSADTGSRRRPSRIRHPCGTSAPPHARMGLSAVMGSACGARLRKNTPRHRGRRTPTTTQLPAARRTTNDGERTASEPHQRLILIANLCLELDDPLAGLHDCCRRYQLSSERCLAETHCTSMEAHNGSRPGRSLWLRHRGVHHGE